MPNYVVFLNPSKRPVKGIKHFKKKIDAKKFAEKMRKKGYAVRNRFYTTRKFN